MNVLTLIQRHPLLHADLRSLGLTHKSVAGVAQNLSAQLGGDPAENLCFVLSGLNCREFLDVVSAGAVAEEAGISETLAQSAVNTIAPWIDRFEMQTNDLYVK